MIICDQETQNGGGLAHPPGPVPAHSECRGPGHLPFSLYVFRWSRCSTIAGLQQEKTDSCSSGSSSLDHSCVSNRGDDVYMLCWSASSALQGLHTCTIPTHNWQPISFGAILIICNYCSSNLALWHCLEVSHDPL